MKIDSILGKWTCTLRNRRHMFNLQAATVVEAFSVSSLPLKL